MADTAALLKELEFVSQTREDKFRPNKFREIFGPMVTNDGAPAWIENLVIHKVRGYARLVPTHHRAGDLPQPDFEKLATAFPAFEYGCAYTYGDRELERAVATGIRPDARRAQLNLQAAEEFLDELACIGSTETGIPGLCNNAAVPTVTAITKGGGGTTWAVATADEIVEDCHNLLNGVVENSKENVAEGSLDLILPLAQRHLMFTKLDSNSLTAEEILRRNSPYLRRVMTWDRLSTLGAGTTPRATAVNMTRDDVARFVLLEELSSDAPRRKPRGFTVDQHLTVVGTIMEDVTGTAYMDGL